MNNTQMGGRSHTAVYKRYILFSSGQRISSRRNAITVLWLRHRQLQAETSNLVGPWDLAVDR